MPHNAQSLLDDVRQAAQLIHDFTVGRSPTDYTTDAMLRAAVEREFIIIGEALSRLEKLDAAIAVQITAYRQIIGFRNILVHGYDAIDDAIVWQVIQQDLPLLTRHQNRDLRGRRATCVSARREKTHCRAGKRRASIR
jgi:uncharacterized protein with HEPN domain